MSGAGDSRCASCGRAVPLTKRVPQGRICGACYARGRLEECAVCGRAQTPNRRLPDGRSVCHTCVRRHDAAAERDLLVSSVAEVVASVEADLDAETIRAAVRRAARDLRQTRLLADAVADGPAALLGGSDAPTVVDRLVGELYGVGATRVSPPTCCRCGTTKWLRQRLDGQRACHSCATREHVERCSRCRQVRPVANRLGDGTALCGPCKHAITIEACVGCARPVRVARRAADGGALCARCAPPRPTVNCTLCGQARPGYGVRGDRPARCQACARREADCSLCGRHAKVLAVWASGDVCSSCRHKVMASKGTCDGCGQRRRIDPRNGDGRRLCSDCAGLAPWSVCQGCGDENRLYERGRCFACVLRRRLDELIGTTPTLEPLRDALTAGSSPRATLRWLARGETRSVLSAVAAGELPLTHQALDGLPATKSLAHLRQVLVACGALPERDEGTARLEAWMDAELAAVPDDEDRRILEAFARWWVLRRYRQRLSTRGMASARHAKSRIVGAIRLMAWLRSHDRRLAAARQADIDLWLTGPPGRRHARDFLRWACRQRLATNLDIVRAPDPVPGRTIDADEQAALARRLLVDDQTPLVVRVAGLFLCCYGQPLARMVRLRIEDVHDTGETVSVRFGRTAAVLPPAIAVLVRELVASPGRAVTGTTQRTSWLFPGAHPGRPLTPSGLKQRLHPYGIDARASRTSVLLDLAGELPPAIIADLIGLYPNTAARWVQAARGDWAAYAAAKAQR